MGTELRRRAPPADGVTCIGPTQDEKPAIVLTKSVPLSKGKCAKTSYAIFNRIPVILFYSFWFLFGILVLRKTQNAIAAVRYVKRHGESVSQRLIEQSREFDDLIRMLDEEFTKPPAFLLLNQYALNMSYNFLCNTGSLPGVHERLIFVTLDTVARDQLKKDWPQIRQFHWPTPSLYKPFSFAEGPYQTIYLLRANLAVSLLKKGKSFWMMQQDTFWRKNLFDLGFEDDMSFDALFDQIGVDENSMRAEWVNGANFFIRANNDTLMFFERLSDKLAHWYTPDMGVMIHQCHTWSRPRCAYIPHKIAHSWEWMYTAQENPPYIMQLDCETDGGSKLMQLGKFGFHFVDSNGTCDYEKVRLARQRMESGAIEVRRAFPSWGRLQFKAYWFIVDYILWTPYIGPFLKPYLALVGYILMITMILSGSQYITRQYTPTFVSQKEFSVPIKIYEGGRMTDKIKDWNVGDFIEWRGPYKCTTDWDKFIVTHLLLIAGGTGIAPFIRIVDKFLSDTNCETIIRLVYCIQSENDILFTQKLVKWAHYWNVNVVVCGNNLKNASIPHLFSCIPDHLTEAAFKQQLMLLCGKKVEGVQVAVCGHTTFEKDVINFSNRAGISPERISRFQI